MMPEQTLTDERQLLVAVRRHLRANGWTLFPGRAIHTDAHLAALWTTPWADDDKAGRILEIRVTGSFGIAKRTCFTAEVDTVREAVDLAVAYGILPLAFSSAYRAGIDATEAVIAELRLADTRHILDLRADGWTLQHPLTCRPNLHDCAVNRLASEQLIAPPAPPGRYEVKASDLGDRLLILDRVDDEAVAR